MKKITKAILGVVMATMFLTTTAVADDFEPSNSIKYAAFRQVSGVVKEVTPFVDSDNNEKEGYYFVHVETADRGEAVFSITDETYFTSGGSDDLQAGLNVSGYFDANAPMMLIYPPRYNIVALDLEMDTDGLAVKVDKFDDQLLSSDSLLRLNIAEDAENIFKQDGTAYEGSLENKNLAVYYAMATLSIPAQASPLKVVVLNYQGLDFTSTPDEELDFTTDVSQMPIIVEGKIIDAPSAYSTEDGVVMVPVRAISEALGYKVSWDASRNEASIGIQSTFVIGKDYYTYARTAPIYLGTAPEINEQWVTYVPLSYFKQVLRINNAYVFEGLIVIDNEEIME